MPEPVRCRGRGQIIHLGEAERPEPFIAARCDHGWIDYPTTPFRCIDGGWVAYVCSTKPRREAEAEPVTLF